jgi:hypothetical protein
MRSVYSFEVLPMKIKEAIKILQDFQTIAGEDAECDIGKLRLVSRVNVAYYDGYGYREKSEKARSIQYSVTCEQDVPQSGRKYDIDGEPV